MSPQPYGRDISEDLAREQQALIELIRENQKQVSELHRLMEQRIELEKMRIAAYQNSRSEYYREESARKQDALQKNQEEDKP
jgi:hypoxanthine-guanine phosphoribosyltransferase